LLRRCDAVERRSLLNESDVEWTDYCINHYIGCVHGCTYCYARRLHEAFWQGRWGKFHEVKPVRNALELLEKDLHRRKPGTVLLSSMCDPYPPAEKRLRLTRRILEKLLDTDFHVLVLTKSSLAWWDIDVMEGHENVELGVTLTTLSGKQAKRYEPGASPPEDRLHVLELAKEFGVRTFVSIEPWIPGVTDPWEIVQRCREFVDRFIIGALNYYSVPPGFYRRKLPALVEKLEGAGVEYLLKKELLEKAGVEKDGIFSDWRNMMTI
jgi:DNA repair photolyase